MSFDVWIIPYISIIITAPTAYDTHYPYILIAMAPSGTNNRKDKVGKKAGAAEETTDSILQAVVRYRSLQWFTSLRHTMKAEGMI